jgi:arylsulfatase A-like enzyme
MTRRSFLAALAVAVVPASQVRPAEPPAPRPPNVVLILADDLGWGDLGCYGQKQVRTPNLDRLAAEGVRFGAAYAGSTVCAPSRCCLLTGRHTGHAAVRGNDRARLNPAEPTLAAVLQKAGYRTACVGKWGFGSADGKEGGPERHGFDQSLCYMTHGQAHNYWPDVLWRDGRPEPFTNVVSKGVASVKNEYAPDLFLKEGLKFIDDNRGRPFFLYFASIIPHANNEAGRATGNGMEIPSDAPYSDRPWPQPQKNHAAMITRLDADVGAILRKLKDAGLDENTVVLFSSDNGPHKEGGADPAFFHSAGPFRGFKRDLTDGGIRVPLLARWPGHVRPAVSDHACAFWDLLPTCAELAGAAAPTGLDGISLVPTLLGRGEQKPHEYLYWEFHERGFQQAVRFGDWKAIRLKQGAPLVLYNLKEDPGETTDRANNDPLAVGRAEEILKGARTPSPYWPKQR